LSLVLIQAVQEFLDERIHYLDIMPLNEACCEAHAGAGWVGSPDLDAIVEADAWARRWVAERVASGAISSNRQKKTVVMAS
jgi:1-deoxy-D-xylulose-5-phosphate reductoisomerase